MSRILRRPMFRGGPVSSYGTGIASGLGYESGGRVAPDGRIKFNVAGLVSPGMATEYARGQGTITRPQNYSRPIGPPRGGLSGGNILTRNMVRARNLGNLPFGIGKTLKFASSPFRLAAGALATPTAGGIAAATAPVAAVGGLAYLNRPKTVEALEYMKSMNESGIMDETAAPEDITAYYEEIDRLNKEGTPLEQSDVGLTSSIEEIQQSKEDKDIAEFEQETDKSGLARRKPGENALDALLREGLEKAKKRDLDDNPPPEPKVDIKAQIDKDKELFAELLGTQKMRRRYGEDVLGELSKGFLEGEGFKGALKRAVGVKSGEDKIDQTAAMLAINDYIAGKRSKEQTEKLIAGTKFKVDYASDVEAAKLDIANMPFEKAKLVMASIMKETDINAPKVIKSILSQKFPRKQINITSFPNDDLNAIANKNATEFNEGINIVQYKGGKILIERIGESVTQVPDLYVT